MKIENNFKKLDEIINKLEKNECNLDEALALYGEGIKLVRECNDSIDKVEKQLMVIESDGEK